MSEETQNLYPIDEVLQKKTWNLPDAYRYCERLTKRHYENFPVGSLLIPKKLRPHVWAIYAYARRADDIADEDFPEEDRLPALEAWQQLLDRSLRGRVNHPIFLALRDSIRQFNIPVPWLNDLVEAFKMDVAIKHRETYQDLMFYCRHSANPVGRLVLCLFGYRDPELLLLSDKICTALQLANFWQDISVDLEKGRIYLPLEDLARFGYSPESLFLRDFNPAFRKMMVFEVERTAQLFREGAALVDRVSGRLALELKCVILGGMGILQKIEALDYNTLQTRPSFQTADKGKILLRALFNFRHSLASKTSEVAPAFSEGENQGEFPWR